MKITFIESAVSRVLVALLVVCTYVCPLGAQTNQTNAPIAPSVASLQNGAYFVLREASTPQEAQVSGVSEIVLAYDQRKYSDAPSNQPPSYVSIDPKDYVPLIIEGAPEMSKDGQGKSILSVSLTRTNAERAEAFTRVHLGGRIAMVVDGEIVTLHKIRSVITGGKLQITRCRDNACEVIRTKLVNP
jgi:preprotein translocase subunit SecD